MRAAVVPSVCLLLAGAGLPAAQLAPDLQTRIDDLVRRQMAYTAVPGVALVVIQGDQIPYARGFGRDGEGLAFTPDTPAYIGSVSKSFTAFAVMQLVAEGRFTLDTAVHTVLPEFVLADPRGAQITVRHLLQQTTGLTDHEAQDWTLPWPRSAAEKVARLRTAQLATDPGTRHMYHNANYNIAARLVEVASGESFEAYLQRHILQPLGTTHSKAVSWMDEARDRVPLGHVFVYGRPIPMPAPEFFVGGAGGVVASARDLARWLQLWKQRGRATNGTQLLPAAVVEAMLTPERDAPYLYQYGWVVRQPGTNLIRHNGGMPTFTAHAAFSKDGALGVAVVANATPANPAWSEIGEDLTDGVVALMDGGTAAVPETRIGQRVEYGFSAAVLLCVALAWRKCRHAERWAAERSRGSMLRLLPGVLPSLLLINVVMIGLPSLVALAESWSWLWLWYYSPVVTAGLWLLVTASALVVLHRMRAFLRARNHGAH